MKIVQVIPKGENSPVAVSGISTIFQLANRHGLDIDYQILSAQQSKTAKVGNFSLPTNGFINAKVSADLILIPSIVDEPESALHWNRHLVNWLQEMRTKNAKLASVCTGAYLLANTDLLNGQEASSHWNSITDLKNRFPKVKWVGEKIITDHDGLYTSGGTLSSFNLIIYLLGKYFDKVVAHNIAKFMQIDYPRRSQKPFFIVSNQKKHSDQQILEVQNYLEQQIQQHIHLDQIARKFGLSRRSLNRRFKEATGSSPQQYIQKVKVEAAKSFLEKGQFSIGEVMYKIGYNDENSFRKLFVKITGQLPSEYKRKFAEA